MKECKNCEYRSYRYTDGIKYWCFAFEFLDEKTKAPQGAGNKIRFENFSLNNDGNCKYYKRKWWKFWVR